MTKEEARARGAAKATATLKYMRVAHSRGRLHMTKCTRAHARLGLPPMPVFTLADQAKLLERFAESPTP